MLSARMPDLPVRAVLPAVTGALAGAGSAVLVAPPGTGKTTLVPLALAGAGRVVVAEPRRVAARAAARRMADLLGEQVGDTVGYTVRGERRVGPRTRVEVVTTGVLVRRLQRDPELPGIDVVLLDECHERHLDTDLALAFTVDVRATLRPDLRLLATSATADARRLSAVLGPDRPAPVVVAESALFPVDVVWAPPSGPVDAPGPRVDPRLLDHVAATVRVALRDDPGDVLVFLPGVGEIAAVAGRLGDLRGDIDVVTLHGRQSGRDQDAALRATARRRVVLSTAVAESSLTVPGVRVVVDAGLARVPRTDHARGLGALVTVPASRASATQRAGRAGREAPGRVYRCWSAARHERLPAHAEPEVAVADLTGFALQLACWGAPDGAGLALPDPPPDGALRVATDTLAALGAVDADGRVTSRGRAIAATGTHPRLARALLDGAGTIGAGRAAEVVALLSDEGPAGSGDDLVTAWRRLRAGADRAATARWRTEVRRLTAALDAGPPVPDNPAGGTPAAAPIADDLAAGLLVGLAYPERLARLRPGATTTYLMAGGTAADLAAGSGLAGTPWLAIAVADRSPGRSAARIRLAAAVDEATAREAGAAQVGRERQVGWTDGDVVARDVERLGAIVLADRPVARPDPAAVGAALRHGLGQEGPTLLTWTPAARALRERLAFCRLALGEPWPAVDDAALLASVDAWLGPELTGARRRADLARIDVATALRRLVPWPQAARLDEVAPERLAVPSGSRIRVDYTDPAAPVLAVKLQETFGWADAPRLADGRIPVLLHLLSPAGRPVAVTTDLASFWRTGYRQVRAELRGRYPRHPWPEDPTTAEPTGRTRPRRA
ncbi:ATP-dependent helicase HrpB [Polymorphospora rubra]|nr:ATP-dependent helicase HrpB [Polymorphospora rubra]